MPDPSRTPSRPSSGKIILLNGASSSGKSTLATALQAALDEPFWHYSIDHLLAANVLPRARIDRDSFSWESMRPSFFAGFHASLSVLANAGNNLIVEHIVETEEWMVRLVDLLQGQDVFFVGLHCPLEELERRERLRGNRRIGEAKADFETIHRFCQYDLEVRSTQPAAQIACETIAAWQTRATPSAFQRFASRHSGTLHLPTDQPEK